VLPQATETQTHRWNLYVRGVNGEEITHVVKKARSQAIPLCLSDLNQCIHPQALLCRLAGDCGGGAQLCLLALARTIEV